MYKLLEVKKFCKRKIVKTKVLKSTILTSLIVLVLNLSSPACSFCEFSIKTLNSLSFFLFSNYEQLRISALSTFTLYVVNSFHPRSFFILRVSCLPSSSPISLSSRRIHSKNVRTNRVNRSRLPRVDFCNRKFVRKKLILRFLIRSTDFSG